MIDLRRLLWRTRGRRWDYTFLLRPTVPARPAWFNTYLEIFPEERERPGRPGSAVYSDGTLPQGGELYVAAVVTDPVRQDLCGRPVLHLFVVVGGERPPDGWAEQLLADLGPVHSRVFEAERAPGEIVLRDSGLAIRHPATAGPAPGW